VGDSGVVVQPALSQFELRSKTAGLLLVLAVVLVYGNFLHNPLVFDDLNFLNNDKLLREYAASVFKLDLRWFSYVTFGWTHSLAGDSVVWHRLINLLFHAATVLVLYRFLAKLFQMVLKDECASHYAFGGALLFAVHPVAVYGVGYLIQRSIVMAALFSLLAMLAWLKGLECNRQRWMYLSVLFYFLAVFSKEHAVMLPCALAAMTILVRRPSVALLREMAWPLLVFATVAVMVVLKSKGILGQPYEPFAMQMLAAQAENQIEFQIENAYFLSILMQGLMFFKYLGLWLVPYIGWMSVDMRVVFPDGFVFWPYSIGFLAYVVYPIFAIKLLLRGGKAGLLGFALFFPWVMFLTEFAAVRIQEPFTLYRSYLWMLLFPAVLPVVADVFARLRINVVLGIVVLLLAIAAWNRLDSFSGELQLWNDAVTKYPSDKVPGAERGYLNRGVAWKKLNFFDKAFADYDKAIEINPKYYVAYSNRGSSYISLFRYPEAMADLNKAIEINPKYASAYSNRGLVKSRLGNYREAIEDFDKALVLEPDNSIIYSNRGVARVGNGDYAGAVRDFEFAVILDATNLGAAINLNLVRKKMGTGQVPISPLN